MKVYRLDPVKGQERNLSWLYSIVGVATCWVRAETADDARERATQGTAIGLRQKNVRLPWLDPAISSCHHDDKSDVLDGFVLAGDHLLPVG
jgi:hypothetical protein